MRKAWIIKVGALGLAALFWSRPQKDSEITKRQESASKSKENAQESAKDVNPRKMNRALEADWVEVNAIAVKYKPQLTKLEQQWTELKANKYYKPNSRSRNPEIQKKYSAASQAVWNTEKAIRTLERKQWAQMEAYLSPYELRKYRMEHSLCGRLLRQETNWMEPLLSEGEFLSLFIRREGELDFFDEHFGGDYGRRGAMFRRAQDKIKNCKRNLDNSLLGVEEMLRLSSLSKRRMIQIVGCIGNIAELAVDPFLCPRSEPCMWIEVLEMKNGLWRRFS